MKDMHHKVVLKMATLIKLVHFFLLLLIIFPSFFFFVPLTETVMDTRTATAELGWISFPANGVRAIVQRFTVRVCGVCACVCWCAGTCGESGLRTLYSGPLTSHSNF